MKSGEPASRVRAVVVVILSVLAFGILGAILVNYPSPSSILTTHDAEATRDAQVAYVAMVADLVDRYNGERGMIRVAAPTSHLSGTELLQLQKRPHRRETAEAATWAPRAQPATCEGDPVIPTGEISIVTVATVDGDRTFAVYVPSSYEGKRKVTSEGASVYKPAPVILLIHGLNDECARFIENTGFVDHAEADGAVIVSLCGSAGWLGTAFNAGMCCGFFGETPDELAFALQALEALTPTQGGEMDSSINVCINREKILTVGFSNGAMLAEVLGCRAPSVFRAVASIGGVTEPRPGGEEGLAKCTADINTDNAEHARPSVLMVHGDADTMVPWGGSYWLGFPSVEDNVRAWVERNGCDPNNATSTIQNDFFGNVIYADCEGSRGPLETVSTVSRSTIELVRVYGGEHRWPERDGFSTTEHVYSFGEAALGGWE